MADTIIGAHDDQIDRSYGTPLIGDREDLAYSHGCRAIESLQLGKFGTRNLARQFKEALAIRGISGIDADLQIAQFRAYYWSRMIGLTYGAERQRSRRKAKHLRAVVDRLRDQTGQPALFI